MIPFLFHKRKNNESFSMSFILLLHNCCW